MKEINSYSEYAVWLVVRSQIGQTIASANKHQLNLNDSIKLGRIQLQLIGYDLKLEDSNQIQEDEQMPVERVSQDFSVDQSVCCRICFSRIATPFNPLVSPCKCTLTMKRLLFNKGAGSMKYVHIKCLQGWLNPHLKIKQSESIIQYELKKMECELCKSLYKSFCQFFYEKRQYFIFNIPKPECSYLMFKVNVEDKQKGLVYVVQLYEHKEQLKIGRIPECDIKLKDISVSRTHAIIHIDYNNKASPFIIEDNSSKFGTLFGIPKMKLFPQNEAHKSNEIKVYQCGNILYSVSVEKKNILSSKQSCYKMPTNVPIIKGNQIEQYQSPADREGLNATLNELEQGEEIIVNNELGQKQEKKCLDFKLQQDL